MREEIYHLQVLGEQRGPYTRKQIDHQLNSGIIPDSTLFVREGMADWAPVTNLVILRRKKRKWKFRGVLIAFLCFVIVMGRFLLPIAVEGWRETAQFQFTEKAAYWRAREAVRHHALPPLALVRFGSFESAHAVLDPLTPGAQVRLAGELTEAGKTHTSAWDVTLVFDAETKQWSSTAVKEVGK